MHNTITILLLFLLTLFSEPVNAQESYFNIELNKKGWESDKSEVRYERLDNNNLLVAVTGERSAMDMDPNNKGWLMTIFFEIPFNQNEIKGVYRLLRKQNYTKVLFTNGDITEIDFTGSIKITDIRFSDDCSYVEKIVGSFSFSSKKFRSLKGSFNVLNNSFQKP